MAIATNHHHLKGLRSPVGVPKFGVKNSWVKIQKPPDQHGQKLDQLGRNRRALILPFDVLFLFGPQKGTWSSLWWFFG
jgi:hypothetical protein